MFEHPQALQSAQHVLDAYEAVQAELPALRRLLGDDDPRIRAATAYLLGWFPEEAEGSVAALRTLLESEAVIGVLANAVVSAGLLSDAELVPRLRELLRGSEPLLRWAAGIALAQLNVIEPEVIGVLAAASADPPKADVEPAVHFLDGDLRGYASQTLAMLDDRIPPETVGAVVEGLSRTSEIAAFTTTAAALRLTFPGGAPRPLPSFAELTEPQQRVVRVLAELSPETWRWANFTSIMQNWHLPNRHAECRAYAGLDVLG
ncbi:HEAT repeat domain-containing protein [Acrocarpospora corrugata]|nr:HEAT repeat domain-containing protein [Acrocarpospora corrugata]